VQSSNPVLTRLGDAASRERGGGPQQGQGQWANPGQNPFQNQYGQDPQYQQPYQQPYQQAPGRVMSLDDVVVRTIMLLALTGVAGALSWILIPSGSGVEALALFGSIISGLVLGLVISFARITNPLVIAAYAVIEGVLLGVVSRYFEARYGGIVMQAVAGTFVIFFVMAGLYKIGAIRATGRFKKFVIGALIAFVALSMINFVAYLAGWNIGLTAGVDGPVSGLAILFSAAGILIGALTFILDFDAVEQGVRYGLPEKYSWYCAFGLLVGLIFLYWQVLRMLSYLRR
jgi:uncharacterized YccA/Bax inhibitor family protein